MMFLASYKFLSVVVLLVSLHLAEAQSTAQERCPVVKDGKWGYIDGDGKVVIPTQFDGASAFHEGVARVFVNGRTVFINTSGRIIIRPRFDIVGDFSEGL